MSSPSATSSAGSRPRARSRRRLLLRVPHPAATARHGRDGAMATAEYALATVAACAFAAVLYVILTSSTVRETLTRMVTEALSVGG